MPKLLKLIRLGNPILRKPARQVEVDEIHSLMVQSLIADIRYTNKVKKAGVGLAAPQVGKSLALSVIGIKPTPNHPELEPFDSVIINPVYKGIGGLTGMWEGCQSVGGDDDILFGQAFRYDKIEAEWYD